MSNIAGLPGTSLNKEGTGDRSTDLIYSTLIRRIPNVRTIDPDMAFYSPDYSRLGLVVETKNSTTGRGKPWDVTRNCLAGKHADKPSAALINIEGDPFPLYACVDWTPSPVYGMLIGAEYLLDEEAHSFLVQVCVSSLPPWERQEYFERYYGCYAKIIPQAA